MNEDLADYQALLGRLVQHAVEFVVVGGVGSVLQGAPIVTFDLDIVHLRTTENVARLMEVLASIDARYRGQGGRTIAPLAVHLESDGHHLLTTRFGPLDLLGTIGKGRSYEDLRTRSESITVAPRLAVSVLTLEALIEIKAESGRPKDLAVLPTLRRTLLERGGG